MRTIAFLALLLVSGIADTKPIPPPKKAENKVSLPTLPTFTNWGKLEQGGRNFSITGHDTWEGVGRIREDGKVFILWTLKSTGEPCPGVYDWIEGELRGEWGYSSSVAVLPDGSLSGATMHDRTYRVEPPIPELPGF